MCIFKIKFPTKRIFRIFPILRINGMAPFCNLFIERPSYIAFENSGADTLNGDVKYREVGKVAAFDQYRCFLGNVTTQDHSYY